MRRDGEGEPHIHARGIALDWRVEEFLNFGEGDDLVEFPADFVATHTEYRAVQVDILAASELRMKPGAYLAKGSRRSP
jgi:hypothetical protein